MHRVKSTYVTGQLYFQKKEVTNVIWKQDFNPLLRKQSCPTTFNRQFRVNQSGILLMTPTEHDRFEHYSSDLRKECAKIDIYKKSIYGVFTLVRAETLPVLKTASR